MFPKLDKYIIQKSFSQKDKNQHVLDERTDFLVMILALIRFLRLYLTYTGIILEKFENDGTILAISFF